MIYLQLFLSFLQVGMFSVGGGYAAMPLIQSQVVEQHGWLTMQEFTDLITIAEMTPGPIAVNSATFVGLRIAQVPGAIIATLGCITPALFFVSLLSYIYRKYKDISLLQSVLACLRPVIVALIFGAGLSILSMVVFGESAKMLANVDWIGIGSFLAHCMNESGSYESFYGYYKLKDDEISITLWPDNSSGNESVHEELVNSDSYKKFFGWGDSGERTFKVEELTNNKMRLDYEGTKYVFRKY